MLGVLAVSGCGADQLAPAKFERPYGACSQMNRAIRRWQGREALECGPDLAASVEITALGHGSLLARHRYSPPDGRFQLEADGTFTAGGSVHAFAEWERLGFTLLPPYGAGDAQPIVLIYDPHSTQWSLAAPGPEGPREVQRSAWPTRLESEPPWTDTIPGGRQLMGIDAQAVLDRNLGDGGTRVWRFTPQADGLFQLAPVLSLAGGPRPAFRRGHRLVPIGPGRLLEWQPVPCDSTGGGATAGDGGARLACARYGIWTYSLDEGAATHDPFSAQAAVEGSWADVGEQDDLLADEAHLYVWTRATGRLRAYALDPTSADPLAPSLLVSPAQTFEALRTMDWTPPTQASEIKHLMVILQDGRSFDSYFGKFCGAGSVGGQVAISCEEGPGCCEGLPPEMAASCVPLDPAATQSPQPNSQPACMSAKMNGGAMDRFAGTGIDGCGRAEDLSCAGVGVAAGAVEAYHALAGQGSLADRFFQTYAFLEGEEVDGARSVPRVEPATENLLYVTAARFGDPVSLGATPLIESALAHLETPWAIYAGRVNLGRLRAFGAPEFHDPQWYPYRDLERGELENDLANHDLPPVSLVLPDSGDADRGEAPGHPIDRAIGFVSNLVEAIEQSPAYRDNTLILLTYLTAGGHYDHVRPPLPPPSSVDATLAGAREIHYGPRVPLLALGRFARKNHVSHVPLEMSSIAVFIEWNWLFGQQLKQTSELTDPRRYRDTTVNNIGSLLDPAMGVPETRP